MPYGVDLWLGRATAIGTAGAEALSAQELARARRFHRTADAARFVSRRLFLRRILSSYLSVDPAAIVLTTTPRHRPVLGPGHPDVRFSQSASGELTVVAVSMGADVGVDVERIDPEVAVELLARRFFTPAEADRVCGETDPGRRAGAFFECWTAKEAVLKAIGAGLYDPLDGFSVEPRSGAVSWAGGRPGGGGKRLLRVGWVDGIEGHLVALARETTGSAPLQVRRASPSGLLATMAATLS